MSDKKYTYSEYSRGECTRKEWVDGLNPIKLEVGKTYYQDNHGWAATHYKIIFIDNNVAMGVSVYSAIDKNNIGEYCLFSARNGLKYQDDREPYRLSREVEFTEVTERAK